MSDVAASMSASIRGKNDAPSISSSQRVAVAGAKSRVSWWRATRCPRAASHQRARVARRDERHGLAGAVGTPADHQDSTRQGRAEEDEETLHGVVRVPARSRSPVRARSCYPEPDRRPTIGR